MDKPKPVDLSRYAEEVIGGLENCEKRLDDAVENQSFYDLDAERYIPQREAESTFDFMGRPKRESGLTREAVEVLCEHLYGPGPSRRFSESKGDELLQRVYADSLIDALMQRADELATLNDVCAIQVDAGEGDYEERPVELHLWGADEFHAWTKAGNSKQVEAVVTIERFDQTKRFKLWSPEEVRVYETKKGQDTAGGRVAREVSREENTYGVIPFSFVHYSLPVRSFWTPGLGDFLRRAEVRVNDRLSRLDESIMKHLNPVPVAEDTDPDWHPIIEPQRFIRLNTGGPRIGASGGFEAGATPRLYYLQATIDVAGAWDDLTKYLNQVFEACRVPLTAVRMEQSGVASGVAIVAEQVPLLTRAKKRRLAAGHFEAGLARTVLTCVGNHYGKPELVAAARKGRLVLGWSEPVIPVPDPQRDELDMNALKLGIKTRLQIVQERHGCSKEEAIEFLKQVRKDRELEDQIDPEPTQQPEVNGDGNQERAPGGDQNPESDVA